MTTQGNVIGPDAAAPPIEIVPEFGSEVSVVMTVLNEERHLAEAVGAVLDQDFVGSIEVILALGPSSDGTDAVAAALGANL